MGILKWIIGLVCLCILFYGLFISINTIKQRERYKRTHFKCTYIKGMCTKKPTWQNCGGGMPLDYCERKINGRL